MSIRYKLIGLLCVVTVPLAAVDVVQAGQAERELFAARFDKAADLYSGLVKSDPTWAPGYYGWVRALLGGYRAKEAYSAAEAAQKAVPGTPPTETVLGMAAYRRGELAEAEHHFRQALQIEPNYPGALMGLAKIFESVSKFKTAREVYQAAYHAAPNDPDFILTGLADQQGGTDHIATLERVLAMYDPQTREGRRLRARLASDKAAGDRKLRQLTSPYQRYNVKLSDFFETPLSKAGVGLSMEINQNRFTLLLDTAASGIMISAKAAKRSGLEGLGTQTGSTSSSLLAAEVKIGDLKLADVPIAVLPAVSFAGSDGLIGTDVFHDFLVGIDFANGRVSLDPFEERPKDQPVDAPDLPAPGFTRAARQGSQLSLPTSVNGRNPTLFLIDSSSGRSLIDTHATNRTTKTTLVFAGFRHEPSDWISFDMTKAGDPMGMGWTGTLGMQILGQMKLTIDYREGV